MTLGRAILIDQSLKFMDFALVPLDLCKNSFHILPRSVQLYTMHEKMWIICYFIFSRTTQMLSHMTHTQLIQTVQQYESHPYPKEKVDDGFWSDTQRDNKQVKRLDKRNKHKKIIKLLVGLAKCHPVIGDK